MTNNTNNPTTQETQMQQPQHPGIIQDAQGRMWTADACNKLIAGRIHGGYSTFTPIAVYLSRLPNLSTITAEEAEMFFYKIVRNNSWVYFPSTDARVQEILKNISEAVDDALTAYLNYRGRLTANTNNPTTQETQMQQPQHPGIIQDDQGRMWTAEACNKLIAGRIHGGYSTFTPIAVYLSRLPNLSTITSEEAEMFFYKIVRNNSWVYFPSTDARVQEILKNISEAVDDALTEYLNTRGLITKDA